MSNQSPQMTNRAIELKKILETRPETVLCCMNYIREVGALDFPITPQYASLENLSRREGLREAVLILQQAIQPPPTKKSNLVYPKKPKIKI